MRKVGILALGGKSTGGIYQYTQSIIDALKDEKLNSYIVFCETSDDRFDNYGLEIRKIDKPNISTIKKTIRAVQHMFFIRKSYFFTKKELDIFDDIDLFLSPAISAYPHFYINKPFIFTLHDMQERYYPDFFTKYDRFVRWVNNKTLAKSAYKIICESNFVKNDIVKFTGVNANKINIIQSPPPKEFIDYKFNKSHFKIVKEKYNLPKKYLFYPAQCWFHKNHIKLVEAFDLVIRKHSNIHLILTGSNQNNYNNLISKINELELNNNVKHLGYIDYEDLPYLYKMSQFLVMPTLFESVSIPIYEAFALEVAVCSSNVVALPEQVGDAGIIFDPNDSSDIAEKIIMYLENDELRMQKAKVGFEKVVNFNHNEYRKKLISIINE